MEMQNNHDVEKQEESGGDNALPMSLDASINPPGTGRPSMERRISVSKALGIKDHRDQTLREKLAYLRDKMSNENEEVDGDLPNDKGKRPFDIKAKYRKIMKSMMKVKEDEELKDQIVAFKYATDMSILRRATPEEVWSAVKRREAWAQEPVKMFYVSCSQIILCLICLLTGNSPINGATSLMAAIYIITICASNPFCKCNDVTNYIKDWFGYRPPRNKDKVAKPNPIGLIAFCIFLSPVLAVVYGVTALLDICIGEIIDLSYGSLIEVIINIIVIFTGFSVGLRSGNAIGAVQTFAGFSFIAEMDEMLMDTIDVDLERKTAHIHDKRSQDSKMLTVRLVVYIVTPLILTFFMYITFTNTCVVFCDIE